MPTRSRAASAEIIHLDKRKCLACGLIKPYDEFHRHARGANGYDCRCKVCRAEEYQKEYWSSYDIRKARNKKSKEWAQRNAGIMRNHQRKAILKRYGMTLEAFEQLLSEQNGQCPICGVFLTSKNWNVDHDHKSPTMRVRGILCHDCNRGIGSMKDDPDRLLQAVEYLRKGS